MTKEEKAIRKAYLENRRAFSLHNLNQHPIKTINRWLYRQARALVYKWELKAL